MDKEQIIQMARDCGLHYWDFDNICFHQSQDMDLLYEFAAAIRAAIKEEDAKICEDEIASWKRVLNGDCDDEEKALIFVQKAIRASK